MLYFETSFPVRYYETDQMAVVHHSNYVRYFETARSMMMESWGMPMHKFEKDYSVLIPILEVYCRYRHPARMGDVLTVSCAIEKVPMARLRIDQKVVNQDGELCAEGYVTLGFIDKDSFHPVRCPEALLNIIEKHINDR